MVNGRRAQLRARAATLKDVASRCGVSTATVARVLHGNGYVAEQTRERVAAAIAETGYRLNAVARGLRKQRTFTIGHLVDSIWPNPFFAEVALGVEREAMAHGCSVLVYNVQGSADRERAGVETLLRHRADAILFTTPVDSANVRLAVDAGIPVVQLERGTSVESHLVTVDNYAGSYEATEHLISLGHRRIAFIGLGWPDHGRGIAAARRKVEEERFSGYEEALRAHGISLDDRIIETGPYYTRDHDLQTRYGRDLMETVLDRRPRVTAVYAACDLLATGVYQTLYRHSLRVPEAISVVGFDDTYAAHLAPALTTVRQPMQEIGSTAVRIVLDDLGERDPGDDSSPAPRLKTRLIVRSSTGPVPREA